MRGLNQHQQQLKLFPGSEPLVYVAMEILRQWPQISAWNQFAMITTDRYSRRTGAVYVSKTTASHDPLIFIGHCTFHTAFRTSPLWIKYCCFWNNYSMLDSTLPLSSRQRKTAVNHPQSNVQIQCFNTILVAQLHQFVNEHQSSWDSFVQSPAFAYSWQAHLSTGMLFISVSRTREQLGPTPTASFISFSAWCISTCTTKLCVFIY